MNIKITENQNFKNCKSENYNYIFDKNSGGFLRWGKTFEDDPEVAPSPEILDFEVTTICNEGCKFCYKSNTSQGKNITFDEFKTIFDKLPKTITQIAFGADADCTANPDLFKMMKYTREHGVIPNITIVKANKEVAKKLAEVAGAVAVSLHKDKHICYDTIKRLSDLGLNQINIHALVSQETVDNIWQTFYDYSAGKIPGLNAIVLLGLKQKGRGTGYHILDQKEYKEIIDYALNFYIPIGADSCSAPKLISAVKNRDNFLEIKQLVDPCESTRFSIYISVDGEAFPCSFTPGTKGWKTGIDMFRIDNFSEVWGSEGFIDFRKRLKESKDENGCEACILYDI